MMSKFLKECKRHFGTTNLYDVLEIEKTASEKAIRKAYYQVSLKVHPDRVDDDEKENANAKFQTLGKVYSVLSDKEKRAVYDEQSIIVDDDDILTDNRDWTQYWRNIFQPLTIADIKKFTESYKGSEEEETDLLQIYENCKGNLDRIMEEHLCATFEDEERLCEIIRKAINEDKVAAYKAFTKESKNKKQKRRKQAEKEAVEAEESKRELGLGDGEDSLMAAIMKNKEKRAASNDAFLDSLAEKYGSKGRKKKK